MTGIDGYDWGSVGWSNPVPGDPDVVRQIGGQLSDLASETSLQNQLLQSVGDASSTIWSGPAANTFHPTMKKLPGQLDQLINSYNDAAFAVNGFWPKQQAAQQLAVRALAKAQAAQAAISSAQSQVSSTQSASSSAASNYNQAVNPPAGTPPPATAAAKAANLTRTANLAMAYRTAQTQLGNAQSALSAARGDMAAAVTMRDQASSDFTGAAGAFVGLITEASKAGIQNVHHGFFSSLGSAIVGGVESAFHAGEHLYHDAVQVTDVGLAKLGSLAVDVGRDELHQVEAGWHEFTHLAHEALPALRVIDTVLSDASLVVGVLALVVAPIPGLDVVLDPALEGLNEVLLAAKTGDDLLELAGGYDKAGEELIEDGIGIATMGIANGLATEGVGDAEKAGEDVQDAEQTAASTSGTAARGSSEATTTADTTPTTATGTGATTTAESGATAEGAEAAGATGAPTGTGATDEEAEGAATGSGTTGRASASDDDAPAGDGAGPAASDPAASDPAASDPAASEPAASGSSSPEPSTTETSASEPSTSQPSEPAASEPAASEPAASGSSASEPAASAPAAPEPAASESAASEPAASEPAASEPSASEPSAAGPSGSEPSASGPSEPTASEPQPPAETPAASSEAPASGGSAHEPSTTEASSSEPASSGASGHEPSTTEASSSEAPASGGASAHEPSASSSDPATSGASPHESSSSEPASSSASGHEPSTTESSSSEAPASSGPSGHEPSTTEASSSEAPASSGASGHEPSTSGASPHEPTSEAAPHETSTHNPEADPNDSTSKDGPLAKILGKEKLKDMRNFRAMKQELSAAKDSISKIETKDLPKSYAGWVKNSYRTDVGVTVGADGKVTAKDGLTSLRKVLYVRDKVETANDIVNFGDTMATGHGVLYHQDNGKDWQTQVWDKTTGSDDEPPTWVSAPLDVLGVG